MSKSITYLLFFGALTLALASCVKNDPAVQINEAVNVNIINASEEVLNFYLNGTRQNSVTGIFPLGANGYTQIPGGDQLLAFRKQFNTSNFTNADTLFTLPIRLDTVGKTVKYYSIFTAGTTRSTAFAILDTLVSDAKNAKLRFVLASQAVTGVRVYLNDTLYFTGSKFKGASTFKPVGNGQKIIKIRPASADNILYTGTVTLNAGINYTLFSAGAGSNFRAGLMLNQ